MTDQYSQFATDVTTTTIAAARETQAAALTAGFELAGKLLEQQRAYTLDLVAAFAKAAAPRKA